MSIDRIVALNAYANSAKSASNPVATNEKDNISFGDILKSSVESSIDTLKTGEAVQKRAISGQASMIEVIEAVNSADLTLRTVSEIRNKLIAAYQEMARMQI